MGMESVENIKEINKNNIILDDLKNIKNDEVIVVQHQKIRGLQIKIKRDSFKDTVLPVVFYSEKLQIRDNSSRLTPVHNVLLEYHEMMDYLEQLLQSPNIETYNYYKLLREKGLKEGDILLFDNGKKGIVIIPSPEYLNGAIRYIPLKKDRTRSQGIPRYLYRGENYEIVTDSEE